MALAEAIPELPALPDGGPTCEFARVEPARGVAAFFGETIGGLRQDGA